MAFNREAALKAGYKPQEVDAYLAKKAINRSHQKESKVPEWAKTALPVGGAVIGGVVGGGLGIPTGPGAVATGVGGAALGGAAGQSAVNLWERLAGGKPPETAMANLQSIGKASGESAISQLLGVGLAKGAGFLSHPIKPFTNKATDILKKSSKTINLQNLLMQFKGGILPKYTAKGLHSTAQEAYKKVAPDIVNAATEITPHVSNFINEGTPLNLANLLKSNLQKGANYGGANRSMEELLKGDFAKLIKQNIEGLEPGVKIPNKIASLLHKVPNTLEDLTYLSPQYRGGLLLRKLGSLPAKTIQKMFPYGGGYLNKILPMLINLQNFPQEER